MTGIAIIGVGLLLFVSRRWGIGLFPDSAAYISAARNLLNGDGLSIISKRGTLVPMTHYPPLFPILLAGIGLTGIDPIEGALWLNTLLFGANIMLVGMVIKRYTGKKWIALFGAFIIMTSETLIYMHLIVWTEALFLFLGTLGIYLAAEYLDNEKRSYIISAAVVIGLAFLTRYPGVVYIATIVSGIILFSKKPLMGKMRDTIIFIAISSSFIMVWLARNISSAGSATNRQVSLHPVTAADINNALTTFSNWLLPGLPPSAKTFFFGLVVIILLIFFVMYESTREARVSDKRIKPAISSLPLLLGIFIVAYTSFLLISKTFMDAHIPFDYRILSPLYISGVILALCLVSVLFSKAKNSDTICYLIIFLCVIFAGGNLKLGGMKLLEINDTGIWYSGIFRERLGILDEIDQIPEEIKIYTNVPDVVYLFTRRATAMLPEIENANTRQRNPDYDSEMTTMREELEGGSAALLYLRGISWRWYLPTEAELLAALNSAPVAEGEYGFMIYK